MGIWTLHDPEYERAVLYDSTTERAFGPSFAGGNASEAADHFLRYVEAEKGCDPRALTPSTLEELHDRWHACTTCATCGAAVDFFDVNSEVDLEAVSDEEFLRATKDAQASACRFAWANAKKTHDKLSRRGRALTLPLCLRPEAAPPEMKVAK